MLSKLKHFWLSLNRAERGLYAFLWAACVALIINAGLAIFFYNYFQKPSVTYGNLPSPITPSSVRPGDTIYSTIQRCSKGNYSYISTRTLIDGIIYNFPSNTGKIRKGCATFTRLLMAVPTEMPSGIYHFDGEVQVTVKWLYFSRIDVIHVTSQSFTVTAPNPVAATDSK